jgi:hypothetical protein
MRWIFILTFSRSGDEAPPFNSPSLNPKSPDVDPTFPFVETVTTTDALDGFIFVNTFTFTLNPSVETYTASYTGTFDLVEVTGVDVFHLAVPTTSAQQLSGTFTQSTIQTPTTFPQSSNQTISSSPLPSSGKRLRAPVIAGGVVGALLALGAFVLLFYVLRRRAKRRNGGHLPLDEEMARGAAPSDEKAAQVVVVPHRLAASKGSGRGGNVGSIQAERDPSLLAEQVKVLKAQLQTALRAQDILADSVGRRTAADAAAPGPSMIRPLSTTKRERERTGPLTVRNYEPVPLLVHTDSGIRLEPAQAVEELPPLYVSRKSFVGQTVL